MPDFSPTQIRSVYIDLCKNPVFSINLRIPTDARIKRECIDLYKKKNTLSDKQIIRNFLQLSDDIEIGLALRKVSADKFKSVVKFLKNITKDPRDETIELVAWLINFKFELNESDGIEDLSKESVEVKIIAETDEGVTSTQTGLDNASKSSSVQELLADPETKDLGNKREIVDGPTIVNPPKSPLSFLNIAVIALLLLLVEASVLFFWRNYTDRISVPTADEKYMYWTGTHYEPIERSTTNGAIPLDVKKLNSLKKIYLSDTLTEKSIGKVWYYGFGKQKHEYFTDSGMHPVDTVKRLRPLTKGILTKYVSHDRFLLNVVTTVFCSIVVAVLLAFGYVYLRRKLNKELAVKTD